MNEKIVTKEDVAQLLNTDEKKLNYILFSLKLREKYSFFEVEKKSGGHRTISAPPKKLLWFQRKLYKKLSEYYVRKKCVHGFVKEFNIVSNAKSHVGQRYVVNIDIKDYFDSIHYGRIHGALKQHPFLFGDKAAEIIAQICTLNNGVLPQGGATSPVISNIILRRFDNSMIQLAHKMKFRYTRYADDITLSCNNENVLFKIIKSDSNSQSLTPEVKRIFDDNNFKINQRKLRVQESSGRQEVTGLIVNKFPNVRRKYISSIEGALHAWEKYGYESAQKKYEDKYYRNGISGENLNLVLNGKIAYLKMVRGEDNYIYRRLARKFNRLSEFKIKLKELSELQSSKLHSSRPSDGWETWIEKYNSQVKLLSVEDNDGNIFSGSAFHIGKGIFVTAGHNLIDEDGNQRSNIRIYDDGNEIVPKVLGAGFGSEMDVGALYLEDYQSKERIPTQLRLPTCGEEVAAIGFPSIPLRIPTLVSHIGTIEALPLYYVNNKRFIQVSFQSGGGLSGGCLIDKAGFIIGIMVENVYMKAGDDALGKPYGQAVPIEYFDEEFQTKYKNQI
ncbi:MAG: reverse transcriptase family protein [bacterium]|nr:reverse transcriptase family protein [bacterium]